MHTTAIQEAQAGLGAYRPDLDSMPEQTVGAGLGALGAGVHNKF
jgi:hypothetical protein